MYSTITSTDFYKKSFSSNKKTPIEQIQRDTKYDLYEIDDLDQLLPKKNDFQLSMLGILPANSVSQSWKEKLLTATILTSLFGSIQSNLYSVSAFIFFSLCNFIVNLIWDKKTSLRDKISAFSADYFMVFVVSTGINIFFAQFTIPFINKNIPYLSWISLLMVVHYISCMGQKLFPLMSLKESGALFDLAISCKHALEKISEEFTTRQEERVIRKRMN